LAERRRQRTAVAGLSLTGSGLSTEPVYGPTKHLMSYVLRDVSLWGLLATAGGVHIRLISEGGHGPTFK